MGVPTSEVGYTPAMPRKEDHEVHKGHVVALDQKINLVNPLNAELNPSCPLLALFRAHHILHVSR